MLGLWVINLRHRRQFHSTPQGHNNTYRSIRGGLVQHGLSASIYRLAFWLRFGAVDRRGLLGITHPKMSLERALDESDVLAEELLALVDLPLCDGSPRVDVAGVACSLAFEHWHAVRLLLRRYLLPSALVVHRSQFEAILRSVWLIHAATDSDIAKLTANLDFESEQSAKNILQTQEMMEALSKSGPENAYAALARFKDNSWKALNSYAHTGIHPLRRHAEGYPEALARGVLCNANGLAVMSGMQAAVLGGAQPLQRQVLDLAAKHPFCMPDPL